MVAHFNHLNFTALWLTLKIIHFYAPCIKPDNPILVLNWVLEFINQILKKNMLMLRCKYTHCLLQYMYMFWFLTVPVYSAVCYTRSVHLTDPVNFRKGQSLPESVVCTSLTYKYLMSVSSGRKFLWKLKDKSNYKKDDVCFYMKKSPHLPDKGLSFVLRYNERPMDHIAHLGNSYNQYTHLREAVIIP